MIEDKDFRDPGCYTMLGVDFFELASRSGTITNATVAASLTEFADCKSAIFDCNTNGIDDAIEISMGSSQDNNANGIPDECETPNPFDDCNTNGVDDSLDILYGSSQDCNSNGVPDECDIAEGTSEDLNNDLIPDECAKKVEVVFLVDSSGSTGPYFPTLCNAIPSAVTDLAANNINMSYSVMATIDSATHVVSSCTNYVGEVAMVGTSGFGIDADSCPGDLYGDGTGNVNANWGPASAIVSGGYSWDSAVEYRILIPISNAGACLGGMGANEACVLSDPTAESSLVNAADVARTNAVSIRPLKYCNRPDCLYTCAHEEMDWVASQTPTVLNRVLPTAITTAEETDMTVVAGKIQEIVENVVNE